MFKIGDRVQHRNGAIGTVVERCDGTDAWLEVQEDGKKYTLWWSPQATRHYWRREFVTPVGMSIGHDKLTIREVPNDILTDLVGLDAPFRIIIEQINDGT